MKEKKNTLLWTSCIILFIVGGLMAWLLSRSINDVSRAEAIEQVTGEPPVGSFSFQNHTFNVTIVTAEQYEAWRFLMVERYIPFNNNIASEIEKLFDNMYPVIDSYISVGNTVGPKRTMTQLIDIRVNLKSNIQKKCDEYNSLPWVRYPTDWDSYWLIATSTLTNDIANGVRDSAAMKISVNAVI